MCSFERKDRTSFFCRSRFTVGVVYSSVVRGHNQDYRPVFRKGYRRKTEILVVSEMKELTSVYHFLDKVKSYLTWLSGLYFHFFPSQNGTDPKRKTFRFVRNTFTRVIGSEVDVPPSRARATRWLPRVSGSIPSLFPLDTFLPQLPGG